jgi:hypothetical protein
MYSTSLECVLRNDVRAVDNLFRKYVLSDGSPAVSRAGIKFPSLVPLQSIWVIGAPLVWKSHALERRMEPASDGSGASGQLEQWAGQGYALTDT